jgi:hypothetical protein
MQAMMSSMGNVNPSMMQQAMQQMNNMSPADLESMKRQVNGMDPAALASQAQEAQKIMSAREKYVLDVSAAGLLCNSCKDGQLLQTERPRHGRCSNWATDGAAEELREVALCR